MTKDPCVVCGIEEAFPMLDVGNKDASYSTVPLCDACREMVVMFFHCGMGSISACAAEAKQAKFGK